MSLLSVIARAEWRAIVRRRGYVLLLSVFAALVIAAGVLNHARQTATRERQEAFQRLVREQWLEQPDRHPHRVAHYGTFAFKPPGPLAAFDPGVGAYTGSIQFLEAHRQNAANFAEAVSLSSMFRLGDLSLAFLLQAVLPLVVIVFGHRVLAEERDSGRLALLHAQGASLRTLAWGKLGGLALGVAPFAGAGLVASVWSLHGDRAFGLDHEGWLRFALIAGAFALHTLAWVGLSVWVSARAKTTARACGVLVTMWAFGCVVAPRAAAAFATAMEPLPDKSSFNAAVAADVRALGDSHDPNDPGFAWLKAETLERHGVKDVAELPFNYRAVVMAYGETLSAETFARHFAGLGETMRAQERVVERAAAVSPFIALRALSTALAGTDLQAELRFQEEAEAYRFKFVQQLNGLHRDKVHYEGDSHQKLPAETWKTFEDFRSEPLTVAATLAGKGWLWAVLALWTMWPLAGLTRLGRNFK